MDSFLYGIVFIGTFQISKECSPVPKKTAVQYQGWNIPKDSIHPWSGRFLVCVVAVLEALASAEQNSVEGRITFSLDQVIMPLAGGFPICSGPAQRLASVRSRLGQTAVFSCPVDRCSSHNLTCSDLDQLLWKYNNYSVWHVLCRGYPSPYVYSQNHSLTTAYLFIHNISYETIGTVGCWCQRDNETSGLCINEAYFLTPLLTPADVFQTPVLNVTHRAGENVTLVSQLRIRMREHTLHRYIVRYNRRIIWAQTSHPLHRLIKAIFPHGVHFALSDANISITLPYLSKSFSGQFEVWVRPYMEEDEFVVQTINLELI